MSCQCPPSVNTSCASQILGNNDAISVAQSECVILQEGTTEENPFFDRGTNMSYWAYKVIVGCNNTELLTPNVVYIPVHENIDIGSVLVFERILSCGRFENIRFDFASPTGITPPEGYKYIRIFVDDRYQRGVSVYYRIEIMGIFPPDTESLYVESTRGDVLEFVGTFEIPGIPLQPSLSIMEISEINIVDNAAFVDYRVTIINTGNIDLTDVEFLYAVNYEGSEIEIGAVVVNPDTIDVDTSQLGTVRLSGNIGDLLMGEMFEIAFSIPILRFNTPGTYNFVSTGMASSGDAQSIVNNMNTVEVVSFVTLSRCSFPDSTEGDFTIGIQSIPDSPISSIITTTIIDIPQGVVIQFLNFGTCVGRFVDNDNEVPLNTDITNREIVINCSATIPASGSLLKEVLLRIISTTEFNDNADITSTIVGVSLQETDSQILLTVSPLPNEARIMVRGNADCIDACTVM